MLAADTNIYARLTPIYKSMDGCNDDMRTTDNTVCDWGHEAFENNVSYILLNRPEQQIKPEIYEPLNSGTLVKIFRSVSKGEIAWHGTVDIDPSVMIYGTQKDCAPVLWQALFMDEMPAKLVRNGREIHGYVCHVNENINEMPYFAFKEYGRDKKPEPIENGDNLTIYSHVWDGDVEWEGRVAFTADRGAKGVQAIKYRPWVTINTLRQAQHMYPQKWLELTFDRRPVVITPAAKMSKDL